MCSGHGATQPFHLVAQFLQDTFRLEDGEPAVTQAEKVAQSIAGLDPELAWTVPYLRHLLGLPADELESEGLDQVQRRRRLIEAVKALTLRGARRQPLVLLAEDLQWIDRHSAEFCAALIESVKKGTGTAVPGHQRFIHNGKALVQVRLRNTSPQTLAKLQKLGFEVVLRPQSAHLIIGRIAADKLAALVELEEVLYVAPQTAI